MYTSWAPLGLERGPSLRLRPGVVRVHVHAGLVVGAVERLRRVRSRVVLRLGLVRRALAPVGADDERDARRRPSTSSPNSAESPGPWRPAGRRPPGRRSGSGSASCPRPSRPSAPPTAWVKPLPTSSSLTVARPPADRGQRARPGAVLHGHADLVVRGGRVRCEASLRGRLLLVLAVERDVLAYEPEQLGRVVRWAPRVARPTYRFGIVVIVIRFGSTFLQLVAEVVAASSPCPGPRRRSAPWWPSRRACSSLLGLVNVAFSRSWRTIEFMYWC